MEKTAEPVDILCQQKPAQGSPQESSSYDSTLTLLGLRNASFGESLSTQSYEQVVIDGVEGVDENASIAWIQNANCLLRLKEQAFALQDRFVGTLSYSNNIIKEPWVKTDTCGLCGLANESNEHLVGGVSF